MNPIAKLILAVASVVCGLVVLPLSLILQYLVLQEIAASPVMWLLFWLYVPMVTITVVVGALAQLK